MTAEELEAQVLDFLEHTLDRHDIDTRQLDVWRVEIAAAVETHRQTLDSVVFPLGAVAERYHDRPARWNDLLRSAWLYLVKRPTPVAPPLQARLAVALWRAGSGQAHLAFLNARLDWFPLQAFVEALPDLELEDSEVVALLRKIWADTSQDLAAGDIRRPLRAWAGQRREQSEAVCRLWLEASPEAKPFPPASFQLLVEAVVEQNLESMAWRDTIIDTLLSSTEVADWELALHLAYLAWPAQDRENIARRQQELVRHLARAPALLFESGMKALAREARRFPEPCLQTATRLLVSYARLLGEESPMDAGHQQGTRQSLAWLCQNALWAAEGIEDPSRIVEAVEGLLPYLVPVEPALVPQVLDGVVDGLAKVGLETIEDFFAAWLVTHEQGLRGADLRDIFPLFITERFPADGGMSWVLGFVIHPDARVRRVASRLISHSGRRLDDLTIERLSNRQALGLVCQLRGMNVHGSVWIPIAIQVVRLKPETREEVQALLIQHGSRDFPGTLQDACQDKTLLHGASPALLASLNSMATAVDEEVAARRALRELTQDWSLWPCRARWDSTRKRQWEQMFREGRRGSIMNLMPHIPVARGAAIVFGDDASAPTELKSFESAPTEMNRGMSKDLLQYVLDCNTLLRRAADLLSTPGEAV